MTVRGITKRIGSIKFSCVSPEEIRKMSATKVITADTYDDEGYPIEMGLMDPHMGVIEPGLRCKTCGCKVDECPGHFGHIDLAMPVIHVGFIKDIKSLLECTCSQCGRLMLSPEEVEARSWEATPSMPRSSPRAPPGREPDTRSALTAAPSR